MAEVARLRQKETHIQVSWHKYRYNEHEEPLMREYAEKLGFAFVPYGTGILPHDRAITEWRTGVKDPNGEDCLVPVADARQLCLDRKDWPCTLQNQILVIDGQGNHTNCSNRSDVFNVRGNLFDTTVPEIFRKRKKDPACLACKAVGGHIYALQEYTRSQWSPIRIAETVYRTLGLQGRFPAFSLWATNHLYLRPQMKKTF